MRKTKLLEKIRTPDTLPVAGTSIDSLDLDRLNFYLASIIEDPEVPTNREQWIERLLGLGLIVDARGMGVRTKVIPLMRQHNGVEPIFEANEDYLKTTLPRGTAKPAS